jgi:hypothetical protein
MCIKIGKEPPPEQHPYPKYKSDRLYQKRHCLDQTLPLCSNRAGQYWV